LTETNPSILFVNPSLGTPKYTDEDRLRSYLSLGTLASALSNKVFLKRFAERSGKKEIIFDSENDSPAFDISVLNLSLIPDHLSIKEYFSDFLKQFNPAPLMVCMTATSAHLDEAAEIARTARQMIPAALRIVGGPHASVAAKDFLNKSEFQVACIGEGVETLSEIALLIAGVGNPDLSMIPGIAFKQDNGHAHSNPLRVPIFELDDYPFPSDSLPFFRGPAKDPAENQDQLIYILSGYGCPHDCIFCAQRCIHGRIIRERSAENIIAEIKCLFDRGFRKFAFVQETFLNRKKRIDAFCRLIEDSRMQIEWTAEARADQLDYEQLKSMQTAGLHFIQIGVESGDPAVLKKIGKGIDLDQIIQLRNWCSRLKIHTAFYLLVGLPGQDWQSVLRSALFMIDHPPYNRITRHASVSIAIPYPGTRMWQEKNVRLIDTDEVKHSWPQRNPDVIVNDAGEFVGKNFTETDDFTSEEILEAWIYLDDFCHFLLHALDEGQRDRADRDRSVEYADRMLYMIQRRTIRDLIIRAQSPFTAATRRASYYAIVQDDNDSEKHFKDITTDTESSPDVLMRFLAAASFLNGFETMKRLSIANRIKWMKICAMVWHIKGRDIADFRFDSDGEKTGLDLDRLLGTLDELKLNRYLARIDAGNKPDSLLNINQDNQTITAFGIGFSIVEDSTLAIDFH
jgi:anaerobic magnesium-protoporphyrin IX monomethyl ester cyclase